MVSFALIMGIRAHEHIFCLTLLINAQELGAIAGSTFHFWIHNNLL